MENDPTYEMCGNEFCYHFIEENPSYSKDNPFSYGGDLIAQFIHLDDGEKEYDHDAIPSGMIHRFSWWKMAWPQLFTGYPDGKIGPNSRYFVG